MTLVHAFATSRLRFHVALDDVIVEVGRGRQSGADKLTPQPSMAIHNNI